MIADCGIGIADCGLKKIADCADWKITITELHGGNLLLFSTSVQLCVTSVQLCVTFFFASFASSLRSLRLMDFFYSEIKNPKSEILP
jgi:hypothetical protein